MSQRTSAAAIALAFGTALTLANSAIAADMPGMEKCYGVALKGKNDCKAGAGTSCAGSAKKDYLGAYFKMVPTGTCLKTASPNSPSGFGQLQAFTEKKG